ncbi:MAG: alkaline phosphatase family protein [Mucilaginibacter polytrichastri]|nr:alkaline phosphatase family protein [Mucilaginibacter polytrichastri]
MKHIIKKSIAGLAIAFLAQPVFAQQHKTQNLVLVTLDGFRWQEVFRGADSMLSSSAAFTPDTADIRQKFWAKTAQERRKKLLPFFWETLASGGQLYGNRDLGNKEEVANPYRFSYPGYNELLTGFPDVRVNSNDKVDNPNVNVLEFLNKQKGFSGKVAAFSSWDVFPWILNVKRSGLPVNSGIMDLADNGNAQIALLNTLQKEMLSPVGDEVRPDVLTFQLAKQYMISKKPRVTYIAFDETDDYAHGGQYGYYLKQAQKEDRMIADLWSYIQSDPFYRDKTTLIVTCDHGRGEQPADAWKNHGEKVNGAGQTWFAVIGPDTPADGEIKTQTTVYHKQLAQTISELLGFDFSRSAGHETGKAVRTVFK